VVGHKSLVPRIDAVGVSKTNVVLTVLSPGENAAGETLSCEEMRVVCTMSVSRAKTADESLFWLTPVSDPKGSVTAFDAVAISESNVMLFPTSSLVDRSLCCDTVPVGRNRTPVSEAADCVAALDAKLLATVRIWTREVWFRSVAVPETAMSPFGIDAGYSEMPGTIGAVTLVVKAALSVAVLETVSAMFGIE
jgi:hypothetical protein